MIEIYVWDNGSTELTLTGEEGSVAFDPPYGLEVTVDAYGHGYTTVSASARRIPLTKDDAQSPINFLQKEFIK